MAEYDGWTIKSPKGYFYHHYFRRTKKEALKAFVKNMIEAGIWQRYRKRGWKLVKVKLVELK